MRFSKLIVASAVSTLLLNSGDAAFAQATTNGQMRDSSGNVASRPTDNAKDAKKSSTSRIRRSAENKALTKSTDVSPMPKTNLDGTPYTGPSTINSGDRTDPPGSPAKSPPK